MSTTISLGVAVAPDNGATIEELFESADRALYEAKLEGRDIAVSAGQARTAGHDQPLTQERFVGRVAERRRLTQLLDESVHSGARLVAVVGEAGHREGGPLRGEGPPGPPRGAPPGPCPFAPPPARAP